MENSTGQNIEQRVNERIAKGIRFDFDPFFADGWRIFKKITFLVAGATFLCVIPVLILYAIAMPFLLGISSIGQFLDVAKDDPYYFQTLQRSPMYLVKAAILGIVYGALFAPLQAGLLKLCRDADKGDVSFGTIFSYYKGPHVFRVIAAVLIVTLLTNAANLGFSLMGPLGSILNICTALVLYGFTIFALPLIIFGNASIGQAFSLSFAVAGKKFFPMLGMLILFGLLACLGVIACCIGIFFTIAFLPICTYLLYKYAIGFPEDEIEEADPGSWQQQPPVM